MKLKTTRVIPALMAVLFAASPLFAHAQQGVTATEILLGANSSLKRPPTA
ncbi:hypothetical protein LP417_22690 [Polaromonas sp. P1-6]|nr:hypothetical protein LP417_22690 [Polaromonas sp. P1-6]